MEILIGYKDPNFVPVKDFYEYNFNVNYLSLFINDDKPVVREEFLETLENWLEGLPDREDHFARLIPYLMTFLFDKDKDLQARTVECLDHLGKNLEREKRDTFREEVQYNIQSLWCKKYEQPEKVSLEPFKQRPRMGTRYLIQNSMSKLIPPIRRELKDSLNYEFRLNAMKLLRYLIFVSEDQVMEYVGSLLPNFVKNLNMDSKNEIRGEINTCCMLMGRYLDFSKVFNNFSVYVDSASPLFEYSEVFMPCFRAFITGAFESTDTINIALQLNNLIILLDFIDISDLLNQNIDASELIHLVNSTITNLDIASINNLSQTKGLLLARMFFYPEAMNILKDFKTIQPKLKIDQTAVNVILHHLGNMPDKTWVREIDIKILFYLSIVESQGLHLELLLSLLIAMKDTKHSTVNIVKHLFTKSAIVENSDSETLCPKLLEYLTNYLNHSIDVKSQHAIDDIGFCIELLNRISSRVDDIKQTTSVSQLLELITGLHRYFKISNEAGKDAHYISFVSSLLDFKALASHADRTFFATVFKEYVEFGFLVNEVNQKFDQVLDLMIRLLLLMKEVLPEDEYETDYLDLYFKFYWQLHIDSNRHKIKQAYKDVFRNNKPLLNRLISKYEAGSRVNKADFYKQFN